MREAQDVELTFEDGEHLLPIPVDMCSDIESGCYLHLEGGGVGGVVVRDEQPGARSVLMGTTS